MLAARFACHKNPEIAPQMLALAMTAAGEAAHRLRRKAPRPTLGPIAP